jgi:hypothetical protein
MGNNITCTINCKYRITVNAIYPRSTVCFGYVILSTLHKVIRDGDGDDNSDNGDDDDDDDD